MKEIVILIMRRKMRVYSFERIKNKLIHKQINKQMLERMWRKGNPSTLLVGMQTGTAIVENSMELAQKTKNGTAL